LCGASQIGAPRLRRLSRDELASTLSDVFPELSGKWSNTLSADPISPHGFDNDAALLSVGKQTARELDTLADALGTAAAAELATLLPCSGASADAACAGEFVDRYGRRLFRRELSETERSSYLALFEQVRSARDFAMGIRYLTRALIQSPHTVYRREVGSESNGEYRLSQHELATELAYTFSGTTPSEALLAQADAGELDSSEKLVETARSLLLSQRGLENLEKFFNAWLGYGRASSVTKAAPEFAALRDEMVAETRRFVGEVAVARSGGLKDLLTAPYTTPSQTLASFYGFPTPSADYEVIERPEGRGIGILAQGSLLAALSAPDGSSPTKRGLLVMERILCGHKPVVPPNVPTLSAPKPGELTTRQRYEESHSQGSCKACHEQFDPIGYGFEHYDELGRYRADEGGLPIDAASVVPNGGEVLFSFDGLEELARGLADHGQSYACVTGLMTTYAFGAAEGCLGEGQRQAFVQGQIGFVDYLASLAQEPHFRLRRGP
jgi:hypothetical protein